MPTKSLSMLELCDQVRELAYAVHEYLGQGYLEKIYENALTNRLIKAGFSSHQQVSLPVYDEDGTVLGNYFADICVENRLIIEIKASQSLTPEHTAQILNYLKCTGIEHGLLINFGSHSFQIRKFAY